MRTDRPAEFWPTNAWCFRFSRYQVLPEILDMPEVKDRQPFKLIDMSRRILDNHQTREQQAARFKRARSDGEIAAAASVEFFIPLIAKGTGQLVNLGDGMFRLPAADDNEQDDVEESALAAGDEEAGDFDGWVDAFSYPVLVMSDGLYPIKFGKTPGDVQARVNSQGKGRANFDNPVAVDRGRARRVGAVELAVRSVVKTRGRLREDVPGTEWIDTTVIEVEKIIAFIASDQQ